MIGGTSGSEMKLCQPSSSQSKSTQTRSSSLGSRKTVAPLDPCCFRFSAPLVEKIFKKRSKSSTVVVARINCLSFCGKCCRASATWPAQYLASKGNEGRAVVRATREPAESCSRERLGQSRSPAALRAYSCFGRPVLGPPRTVFDREEEGELVSIHG